MWWMSQFCVGTVRQTDHVLLIHSAQLSAEEAKLALRIFPEGGC